MYVRYANERQETLFQEKQLQDSVNEFEDKTYKNQPWYTTRTALITGSIVATSAIVFILREIKAKNYLRFFSIPMMKQKTPVSSKDEILNPNPTSLETR